MWLVAKNSGSSLLNLTVGVTLTGILILAFISFVRATSKEMERIRTVGVKEDLRRYIRSRIDCNVLATAHSSCLEGDSLEVRSKNTGTVLISHPSTALLGLPFVIRAICKRHPSAPSPYQIEVTPTKNSVTPYWEVLFAQTPPC